MDGIMGMAMQGAASDKSATVMETLAANGVIKEKIFSFFLSPNEGKGSKLIIGPPDVSTIC